MKRLRIALAATLLVASALVLAACAGEAPEGSDRSESALHQGVSGDACRKHADCLDTLMCGDSGACEKIAGGGACTHASDCPGSMRCFRGKCGTGNGGTCNTDRDCFSGRCMDIGRESVCR